jgi:hypothetical protein
MFTFAIDSFETFEKLMKKSKLKTSFQILREIQQFYKTVFH